MEVSTTSATCLLPHQFATGLVSPRTEFASSAVGSEVIPPFAKGVTVGGMRFRYSYSLNTFLAVNLDNLLTFINIRSALVVLPLGDQTAQAPAFFPQNVLHYNGTVPEVASGGLGYTRPRILWRGYDELKFVGSDNGDGGDGFSYGLQTSQEQPDLQVVKSKVSLGHNECLYFITEFVDGINLTGASYILELDLFGVAAVKPTTQTR